MEQFKFGWFEVSFLRIVCWVYYLVVVWIWESYLSVSVLSFLYKEWVNIIYI